ncbi:MAG: hypothetical protein REI94_15585 [Moraxellaceae bacterium]|nr:hypothetical protein [Moraxellaceae bacterium]
MSHASQAGMTPAPGNAAPQDPGAIVEEFLRLIMIPDPEAASRFVSPQMAIRFTGGRRMARPADCTAFNAGRYAWVKKKFERTDVVRGASEDEAVVYNIGTLYGAWPDGTPFEGNRYVDRYVLRQGLIVQMDVWNDSAEWMLVRAGLAEPWDTPMNPATRTEAAA